MYIYELKFADVSLKMLLLLEFFWKILTCSSSSQAWYSSINPENLSFPLSNNPLFVSVLQKTSLEEESEFLFKVPLSGIPDSNISGLEQSERMASISTNLRAFFPHFRRVYDQQSDLQLPNSPLLNQLSSVRNRSRMLANVISCLYRNRYPNQPGPEPAGGPTKLPPPQSIFQQKVYGYVVLETYREFLSKVKRELRTMRKLKV